MGVTLLFLFWMGMGCPSNWSILHISSSFTFRTAPRLVNYPQQFGAENIVIIFFQYPNSQPSSTTWCERQIKSNSFLFRKRSITFRPQQQLIPRSWLSIQPSIATLGSDHSRSATNLFANGSVGRFIWFMAERCLISGLRPPCTQKMRLETTAAMGKQLKVLAMSFHTLMLTLLLHSSQKPYSLLSQLDQWFPRSKKKLLGYLILQAMSRQMHQRDCLPRSTQSPRNRQLLLQGLPNSLNRFSRSRYCPWVSPQICTGDQSSSSMGWSCIMLRAITHIPSISYSFRANPLSLEGVQISFIMASSMFNILRFELPYILFSIFQKLQSKLALSSDNNSQGRPCLVYIQQSSLKQKALFLVILQFCLQQPAVNT